MIGIMLRLIYQSYELRHLAFNANFEGKRSVGANPKIRLKR